jgi:hypothetical protein
MEQPGFFAFAQNDSHLYFPLLKGEGRERSNSRELPLTPSFQEGELTALDSSLALRIT